MTQTRDREFYRTAGYNAFRLGKTAFDCPYGNRKSMECQAWLEGYVAAKRAKAPRFEVSPMVIRRPIASRIV